MGDEADDALDREIAEWISEDDWENYDDYDPEHPWTDPKEKTND